jgi:hypothetical protein
MPWAKVTKIGTDDKGKRISYPTWINLNTCDSITRTANGDMTVINRPRGSWMNVEETPEDILAKATTW